MGPVVDLLGGRMVDDGVLAVRRRGAAGGVRPVVGHVVLGSAARIAAGPAPARTGERDQAGDDAAEQRQEDDPLIHLQPFIRLMSSTAIEPRFRKKTTRMASPIAASAAATVSTRRAKTCPTRSCRKLENATRLTLTASRMSSTDIRMTMTFLRLMKMPKMPSVNRIAPTVR